MRKVEKSIYAKWKYVRPVKKKPAGEHTIKRQTNEV